MDRNRSFWFLSLIVVGSLIINSINCQNFFVSSTQTNELIKAERQVVLMLENYVKSVEARMAGIKRYLKLFDVKPNSNLEFERNPLSAYLLLKRNTVDIDEIIHLLEDFEINDIYANLTTMRDSNELPGAEDLHGAAIALVRLQHTYSLNTTSMARGVIQTDRFNTNNYFNSIKTGQELSGRDCFFLGKHSLNENLVSQSIDWFETAIDKSNSDVQSSADINEILPLLNQAFEMMENLTLKERLEHENGDDFESIDSQQFESKESQLLNPFVPWQIEHDHFRRLCRGEQIRPAAWDRDLTCSYFNGYHPYHFLNPIKLEVMSNDPYIVVLHDVINDQQIDLIKEIAKPNLQRSSHYSPDGDFKTSMMRTSSNAWLKDEDNPLLERLNQKLKMITGLEANYSSGDSEWYQVVNYGIGGHYVPHQDYLQFISSDGEQVNLPDPYEEQMGDRIATFMFYLTDVEAGGATAFPTIGISIFPKKGSAAFWWNLHRNGKGDPLTRHGACPVLYGTKWVANKWFRSHSQMFKKPCHFDQHSKLQQI